MYLQDMCDLEQSMPSEDFKSFTSQGGFSVRRNEKFWSDMTIEQFLMKQMKINGGLTRDRGVSEGIFSQGMASQQKVCDRC